MPKKYRVDITETARRDLLEIRDYIARDKPVAAKRWVARIKKKILALKSMPLRHEVIPEAAALGIEYRHTLVGAYRAIYRVVGDQVIVVASSTAKAARSAVLARLDQRVIDALKNGFANASNSPINTRNLACTANRQRRTCCI